MSEQEFPPDFDEMKASSLTDEQLDALVADTSPDSNFGLAVRELRVARDTIRNAVAAIMQAQGGPCCRGCAAERARRILVGFMAGFLVATYVVLFFVFAIRQGWVR